MKLRPFIEWRPNEIGFGFSFSFDRETVYSLEPGEKTYQRHWLPNIWIHVGPVVAGVGLNWGVLV